MTMQDHINRAGSAFKKHAPEILTGASVVGLGATAYLTGRAAFKAGGIVVSETLTRAEAAEVDDLDSVKMTPQEIVKETWKLYIPAMVVGLATCAAVISGNTISRNRQIALISAAAIVEQAHREYQDKVIETTSKPKEKKIHDAVLQDKVDEKREEINGITIAKEGDMICLEKFTGRIFVTTADKINKAEIEFNREVIHSGGGSVNEFLGLLGLPYVDAASAVGWNNGKHRLEVRIGAALHEDRDPILTLDYLNPPVVNYNDVWAG